MGQPGLDPSGTLPQRLLAPHCCLSASVVPAVRFAKPRSPPTRLRAAAAVAMPSRASHDASGRDPSAVPPPSRVRAATAALPRTPHRTPHRTLRRVAPHRQRRRGRDGPFGRRRRHRRAARAPRIASVRGRGLHAPGGGATAAASSAKHAFGTRLKDCELAVSYNCRVPDVLVHLWKTILQMPNGVQTEGIFRMCPTRATAPTRSRLIARGFQAALTSRAGSPRYLIKSFLQRLPPPGILGKAPMEIVKRCVERTRPRRAKRSSTRRPHRAAAAPVAHSRRPRGGRARQSSLMNLKNLTVVFAPNLWLQHADDKTDPLELIQNVESVATSFYNLYAEKAARLPMTP